MTTAVEVFQFPATGQQIRTVLIDGEPWFLAADACRVLDLDPSAAMRRLDDDEYQQVAATLISNQGQGPARNVVSESGLFSLILGSRKPEAKAFKRWVTREVLPAIRKTGKYELAKSDELNELEAARRYLAKVEENFRLKQEIAEAAPKVEAYEALMDSHGSYSMGQVAKILRPETGLGRNGLFEALRDAGVLMADNSPYQQYAHHFRLVAKTIDRTAGPETKTATRVYGRSLDFIRRKLGLARQDALIPLN